MLVARGPHELPRCFRTSLPAQSTDTRCYELRIYTAAKGKLNALQKRFREHTMALFENHGMTNVGYWMPLDNPAKLPTNAQKIFVSLWGTDTLKNWMGALSYTQPASLQVDRIAFTAERDACQWPQSVACALN